MAAKALTINRTSSRCLAVPPPLGPRHGNEVSLLAANRGLKGRISLGSLRTSCLQSGRLERVYRIDLARTCFPLAFIK